MSSDWDCRSVASPPAALREPALAPDAPRKPTYACPARALKPVATRAMPNSRHASRKDRVSGNGCDLRDSHSKSLASLVGQMRQAAPKATRRMLSGMLSLAGVQSVERCSADQQEKDKPAYDEYSPHDPILPNHISVIGGLRAQKCRGSRSRFYHLARRDNA